MQTSQNGMNTMEMLKTQMMSMMMIKNMNSTNGNSTGVRELLYIMIITQVVEFIMKYVPTVIASIYSAYLLKFQKKIETKMIDGIMKTVKSSITVTVKMNDTDNHLALALMDFITNNKNTTRVSFKNRGFILNEQTDIQITPDIYAIMRRTTDDGTQLESLATNSSVSSSTPIIQVVEIYSYTKTVDELRAFMEDVKTRHLTMQKNKLGNNKYYFNMVNRPAIKTIDGDKDFSRLPAHMSFTMKRFQTNRKFSNLFGSDIETIRDRVNFFVHNREWYDEKGIPYTLGLLLSGKPGTGKTSTIKCLANETDRHIFNINFNNDITKIQLENLFFNEQVVIEGGHEAVSIPFDQRIYVFEDIDCQNAVDCISRNVEQKTHQLDLSFLLNLFDGVLEMPGRIIIMTSNNPERLDHALIRPGRIDIVANYSNCTNETIKQMIAFFYNCTLDVDDCAKIDGLVPLLYTPAEVGKILFENFGNKDGAIDCLLLAKEEEESQEEEEEEEDEKSKTKEPKTSSIYNSGFDSDPLSYESYSSTISSSLYK
jgi:ATP-dependent 26S proteasome regulatory subunit